MQKESPDLGRTSTTKCLKIKSNLRYFRILGECNQISHTASAKHNERQAQLTNARDLARDWAREWEWGMGNGDP